ncbi:hypothetical protein RHO13_05865 [Orbus wheelerorum]|uniref:toxin VasX n=1 Tax=Orbus wheelerorum TaxID=3074111 RepID=UPI00370DCE9D
MGVEHNNQEQQQQQTGFEPKLINEASEKEMALDSGQCGACGRRGFPLFLVRKSIVPKTFQSATAWEQGMVSLGDREPQPASWQDYHYAYRTLREGYVYILCNRIGNTDDNKLEIMVYEVTHGGAFRLREFRDVKGSRPKEIPQSCVSANHHVKAQFITIDNRVYDKAWIAYTPVRWTIATLKHYRNTASEREQRFSKVDLTQQKATNVSEQGRSFVFRDFLNKARFLLELECDNRSVCDYFEDESQQGAQQSATALGNNPLLNSMRKGLLGKQGKLLTDLLSSTASALTRLFNQTFYTASHFNSLNNPDARAALDLTVSKYELDKDYGTAELTALVVEDSFGVAEELAIQRRQRLGPVAEGLSEQSETSKQALSPLTHLVRNSSHDIIYEQQRKAAQSKLASAMQESGGRDTFAQYYQEKAASINSYPLAYFTPEVAYARNHYRHIEQYKAALRASFINDSENEAYLFLFYNASQNYAPGKDDEQYDIAFNNQQFTRANNELNFLANESKPIDALPDIDKIKVIDVIGEDALADKLGIEPFATERANLFSSYLYCRRLSKQGIANSVSGTQGLGDYEEERLTEVQQKALLAQYAKMSKGPDINFVNSVKVVKFYNLKNIKDTITDKKLIRTWDERKKRLNQSSVGNYEQLEKDGYASLLKYVDDSSKDYYHYLIWLFGEDISYYQTDQTETKASLPKALNTLPFWRNEIIPNSSDMHLSFLITFLIILDSDNIGTMTLPLHAALWGLLFNNTQSIYFYLLGDIAPETAPTPEHTKTYWNTELAATQSVSAQAPNTSTLSQNSDTDAGFSIPGFGSKELNDTIKDTLGLELKKDKTLMKILAERMITTCLEGVNKAVSSQVHIDDLMARSHFVKVINLFKGNNIERVRQYQVTMTVKGLQQYLRKMDEFTPFFFNEQMKTDKGNIINVMQNRQGRWHIPQGAGANEKVTVNMLMAFENPENQQKFEDALKRSQNGAFAKATLKELKPNIVEMNNTPFDDTDIDTLSTIVRGARQQRYIEIIDTSSSFVLGGVSLYFQVMGLRSLQKQIDTFKDPVSKTIMQLKVMSGYAAMIVTATELVMRGAKLMMLAPSSSLQLFLGRSSTLYSYLNKYLDAVGAVGKIIGVVDSAMALAQSIMSLYEGNTGAKVAVASSVLSVVTSLAAFANGVPVWGQIAFIFISIGAAIITAIYYSDGSEWDEIDKWLNRSMLGNFDFHASKYPPYYLPTPVCMQLSQQDYYLAVNGGRCLLESESGFMSNQYDLYLDLRLPDFNEEKSKFKGTVTIKKVLPAKTELDYSAGTMRGSLMLPGKKVISEPVTLSTTLQIEHGNKQLVITSSAESDYFTPRAEKELDSKKEMYRFDKKEEKEPSDDELLWDRLMAVTTVNMLQAKNRLPANPAALMDNPTGLFLIKQKLGQVTGSHEVTISINYWPNGFADKDGKALTPYLLSYHYKKG